MERPNEVRCVYQEWKYIAQGDEGMWGKECFCKNPKHDTICDCLCGECEDNDGKTKM